MTDNFEFFERPRMLGPLDWHCDAEHICYGDDYRILRANEPYDDPFWWMAPDSDRCGHMVATIVYCPFCGCELEREYQSEDTKSTAPHG